ncbi:hypothetical protein VIGAN_03268600, partial [Vigna angularis var. angularis]
LSLFTCAGAHLHLHPHISFSNFSLSLFVFSFSSSLFSYLFHLFFHFRLHPFPFHPIFIEVVRLFAKRSMVLGASSVSSTLTNIAIQVCFRYIFSLFVHAVMCCCIWCVLLYVVCCAAKMKTKERNR